MDPAHPNLYIGLPEDLANGPWLEPPQLPGQRNVIRELPA